MAMQRTGNARQGRQQGGRFGRSGGRPGGRPGRPGQGGPGGQRRSKSRYREQSKCRFCRDKVGQIDHKDIPALLKLTTQQGKIFSRKRSGNCARHQRSARRAIKRARLMALLPYVA